MSKKDKYKEMEDNQPIGSEETGLADESATSDAAMQDDGLSADGGMETDKTAQSGTEASEWKDKYLRLSAEFDNYRKRTLREKMSLIETGGEEVIKSILSVMDDIDRALAAIEGATDTGAVKEGVFLISQKLSDALRSKGVSEIEAVGLPLDTDVHEAVAKFPVEDPGKKGKIIDVVQKGYKLNDKVVRHAKVVVGE